MGNCVNAPFRIFLPITIGPLFQSQYRLFSSELIVNTNSTRYKVFVIRERARCLAG